MSEFKEAANIYNTSFRNEVDSIVLGFVLSSELGLILFVIYYKVIMTEFCSLGIRTQDHCPTG